jgi:hypothetical protein
MILLLTVAVGLVLAGCDSGPAADTASGIISPVNPQLDFGSIQPDSSRSDTLMLEYRGLSERPRVDTASLPDVYAVETLEETGAPDNGSSSFRVTFSGSQPGDYASPIRFRASDVTGTVQFAGIVIGPQTIADFESDLEGFLAFNGPGISQVDGSQDNGELLIEGTNLGGPGVFPVVVKPFSNPVNFEDTPVIEMRVRVAASSDGPAVLRTALNGAEGNADANATVPDLVAEVPADGEYATYYFTFRDNFVQFDGVPVDPTQIGELVILVNDNRPDTFTGDIYIDEIRRRPAIPESAE